MKEYTLIYTLTGHPSGKTLETVTQENPLRVVAGSQQLLPAFEAALESLSVNDTFDFIIPAAEAYGPSDPYAIFDIPVDTFEVDGQVDDKMLQMGNVIPMTDQDGNKHMGEIIAIGNEVVTLDFNHPLAGVDLRFKGTVIAINQLP